MTDPLIASELERLYLDCVLEPEDKKKAAFLKSLNAHLRAWWPRRKALGHPVSRCLCGYCRG